MSLSTVCLSFSLIWIFYIDIGRLKGKNYDCFSHFVAYFEPCETWALLEQIIHWSFNIGSRMYICGMVGALKFKNRNKSNFRYIALYQFCDGEVNEPATILLRDWYTERFNITIYDGWVVMDYWVRTTAPPPLWNFQSISAASIIMRMNIFAAERSIGSSFLSRSSLHWFSLTHFISHCGIPFHDDLLSHSHQYDGLG